VKTINRITRNVENVLESDFNDLADCLNSSNLF
jgi:hypothetical protein